MRGGSMGGSIERPSMAPHPAPGPRLPAGPPQPPFAGGTVRKSKNIPRVIDLITLRLLES